MRINDGNKIVAVATVPHEDDNEDKTDEISEEAISEN